MHGRGAVGLAVELCVASGNRGTAVAQMVHLLNVATAAAVSIEAYVAVILSEGWKSGSEDWSLLSTKWSTSLIECQEKLRMTADIGAISERIGLVIEHDLSRSSVSRVNNSTGGWAGEGSTGAEGIQDIFVSGSTGSYLKVTSQSISWRREAGGGEVLLGGWTSLVAMCSANCFGGTR